MSAESNTLSVPTSEEAKGGHGRTASIQAIIDVVKAAKQRDADASSKREVMERATARKQDPLFAQLGQELHEAHDSRIQVKAEKQFKLTQAELLKAAQAKIDERAKLEEERTIVAQRKNDNTFKALGSELHKVVAEKEFKHNNDAAWEQIKARQKSSSLSQLNSELNSADNIAKLRPLVSSVEDAAAEMKRKLAAAKSAKESSSTSTSTGESS